MHSPYGKKQENARINPGSENPKKKESTGKQEPTAGPLARAAGTAPTESVFLKNGHIKFSIAN
jgi:hypothetical protein